MRAPAVVAAGARRPADLTSRGVELRLTGRAGAPENRSARAASLTAGGRFSKGYPVMQSSIKRRIRLLVPALAATAVLAAGVLRGAERIVGPAEARLRGDVTFLADDAREGRAPGTTGIEAAAEYLAAGFKEAGLKPAPGARRVFSAVHDSAATPRSGPRWP